MLSKMFSVWIGALPLVFWNGIYEGPKTLWFLVGGVFLLFFWIQRILLKDEDFDLSKADFFYLLWLAVLLISSLSGVHPYLSVIGGSYRRQGIVFFLLLWLVRKTAQILKPGEKKFLTKCVAASVLIESAFVVFQFAGGNLYFGKPLGTIGEANAVAGFLAIGQFFVLESFPILASILSASVILVTTSRAGILAATPIAIYKLNRVTTSRKYKKIFSIFFVLLVAVLVSILSINKKFSIFENRLLIWNLGTKEIVERPLLGFGAESGEVVYDKAFEDFGLPLYNMIVDRSHNLFLDVAMWSGIVGLILFAGWLAFGFKELKDKLRKLSLVAFLIYAFFQPLSIVHWILLFLIL